MSTYSEYSRTRFSIEEYITHPTPEYSEGLETASDDNLRSWILSKGYTDNEIDHHIASGISLREIASDFEASGYIYPG